MSQDFEATGIWSCLDNAQVNRNEVPRQFPEGAEQIYRCVARLRDELPTETKKCLAAIFEWALQGINNEIPLNRTRDMEALCAAISYARDVLVETPKRDGR